MFQVPISAPTASRMNTAPTAEVTPPTAASATAATRVAVLERDQAGERRAEEQRDLQWPVGRIDAEQDDRRRQQDDQDDDRQHRVEQRRRPRFRRSSSAAAPGSPTSTWTLLVPAVGPDSSGGRRGSHRPGRHRRGEARRGETAASTSTGAAGRSRRRRIHLSTSTTTGRTSARPRQASHCRPASDWVSSPRCRNPSSVDSTSRAAGMTSPFTADRIGGIRPLEDPAA